MSAFKKITYYNLREEALAARLPLIVGRENEMDRLDRVVGRRMNNNVLLVGPGGIGKTTLIYGWVRQRSKMVRYQSYAFLQLDAEHLGALEENGALEEQYTEVFCIQLQK